MIPGSRVIWSTNRASQAPPPFHTPMLITSNFFFKVYVFIFEIKTEHMSGEGAEKEGERERIPSRLCAVRAKPDVGLELTNYEIMT